MRQVAVRGPAVILVVGVSLSLPGSGNASGADLGKAKAARAPLAVSSLLAATAPLAASAPLGVSDHLAAGDLAASQASFNKLAARLSGSEAVAYTVLGGGATTRFGSWRTGPAWSTVKVPVAVAAVTKAGGHPGTRLRSLMRRSITASDNAATEQLWAYLGKPTTAAARTQAVLRSAGDANTRVQSRRVRPGFSAYGQTTWSLASQAAFAAKLPCIRNSAEVLRLMGQVKPGQRWGIGAAGRPAQFKGGWGPRPGGGYLVRQMGIVTLPNGTRIGLAIASQPADGRLETGAANLSALARWAVAHAKVSGRGGC
jgi:hypothetical protein